MQKPVEKAVKPPKKPTTEDDKKKKREKPKNFESYSLYISRVLRTVHQDIGITTKAIAVMDSFIKDIFDRIAMECSSICRNCGKNTITKKEVETATKLVLLGDLRKHAVSEGERAVKRIVEGGSSVHSA